MNRDTSRIARKIFFVKRNVIIINELLTLYYIERRWLNEQIYLPRVIKINLNIFDIL